jgi:hypothetical protein
MNLENIPISSTQRDKAWSAFIKKKSVQEYFNNAPEGFRFPLERGWYELWCQAWESGYQAGFDDGHEIGAKANEHPAV